MASELTIDPRHTVASFPPVIRQNPYQRLLYEHLRPLGFELADDCELKLGSLARARKRVSLLHFHWPQNYYYWLERPAWARLPLSWARVALFGVRLAAARALGYRVVWTIHQVYPHESLSPVLDRFAGRLLARFATALVAHDAASAKLAERELRLRPGRVAVVPHASYVGVYPRGRSRDAVRAELRIPGDAFVFLSFGHVRAYKEITLLLTAFTSLADERARLVVAGMPLDEDSVAEQKRWAALDPRIEVLLDFVADERVAELFGACDACVFARGDGGTSGALILALSLGLPVVAADTETYAELLGNGEAGWLFRAGDAESLREALASASGNQEAASRKAEAAARAARALAWPEVAPRYAEVLARER